MDRMSLAGRCLMAIIGAVLLSPAPASGTESTQWYTLSIDDARVGYAWRALTSSPAQQRDVTVSRVAVTQLRRRVLVESRTEVRRAEDKPVFIRVESLIGQERHDWQGLADPDDKTLTVSIGRMGKPQRLALPAELVWPDALSAALEPLWRGRRDTVDLDYLDPASASLIKLQAQRLADEDQTRASTVRIRTFKSLGQQSHAETFWFSAGGELQRAERSFFGAPLVWLPCSKDCDADIAKPFDVMARMVVQSPYRIPASAYVGPIRYVIRQRDGTAPKIPATSEQAVVYDGATTILTICASCGNPEGTLSEAERQRYLRPNRWVQSDHPEIRHFANRHGSGSTPVLIMNGLVEAVRSHMTGSVDYLGYSSALEALRTRSGDCTEYAVLLAALARARNIPARVMFGLVYADRFSGKKDVFSPHAWVQAWTGERWQSFDAGIGAFDATHVASGISDGDPHSPDNSYVETVDWRIEKLGRVKQPAGF